MKSNGDIDAIFSTSCMAKNVNEVEHIITGMSDDELNDYCDMPLTTIGSIISEKQRRRMFD